MKIKVFYSWQSDIDFNNQSIRDALKLAIIDIEKEASHPRIDSIDSTSNLTGASHIPENILKEISACDIFICDLTIIGKSITSERKISNPNVLIELGYAIAQLSWYRTIVIFNEHFGDLKQDLPFDIEKRSVLTIKILNKEDSNGKGILKTKLKDWIQKIIKESPIKPTRSTSQPDFTKRAHDLKTLKQFLKYFDVLDVDHFFSHGHVSISRSFVRKWDELYEFMNSKNFFMYDQTGKSLLSAFQSQRLTIKELLKEYQNGTVYYKHKDQNGFAPNRFDKAKSLIGQIEKSYAEIINYIRMNYLEIKFNKRRS